MEWLEVLQLVTLGFHCLSGSLQWCLERCGLEVMGSQACFSVPALPGRGPGWWKHADCKTTFRERSQ